MTTADKILNHLSRQPTGPYYQSDGSAPTAKEIATAIDASASTVAAALRKLEANGKVRTAGETYDGVRTWKLTEEP